MFSFDCTCLNVVILGTAKFILQKEVSKFRSPVPLGPESNHREGPPASL